MGLVHSNVSTFNRALTAFAQEVGYTIEYAALREAALMCRDAIVFTPPFKMGGGGGETKLDLLEDGALPDASEAVEAKEIAQAIDEALERLKVPGAQEVLRLKYCEQRTQAQIAAQTGLTCPEVKSIVDRSLRALLRDWRLKRAVSLWDELPSYSTGVQSFKASGSQTERAALWLIDRGA